MWKRYSALLILLLATASVTADDNDRFLPADAAVVARFRVQALLDVPALHDDKEGLATAQKLLGRILSDYDTVRKHLTAAGIDINRDVAIVTTAISEEGEPDTGFVVLEGAFDPFQFRKASEAAANKPDSGLKLIRIGAYEVCSIAAGRREPLFACLVDKSTILGAATREKLEAALQLVGTGHAGPPKEAAALLHLLDTKQHLSLAGRRSAVAKLLNRGSLPLGELLLPLLESIETLQCGLTLGKECEVVLRFGTKDEKAAKAFFQQTTLLLAAARGVVAAKAKEDVQFAPLTALLKGLHTGMEGTTVVWRSRLPLDLAEKVLRKLASQ
jgi:hypothetical protein